MWKKFTEWFNKNKRFILFLLLFVFSIGMSARTVALMQETKEKEIKEITYPELIDLLEDGAVDTVYYSTDNEYMTVTLYNDETKKMTKEQLEEYEYDAEDKRKVLYPAYDEFRKDILEYGANLVLVRTTSTIVNVISYLFSLGLPILWIALIFNMLKSQNKGMTEKELVQTSDIKFENVIGQDEVIKDVKFVSELLQNKDLGVDIGAKVPKGMLLAGEPGTGKTLIAKAIAGEAGVPFIYVNSSSLIEMFVGLGAKRVRDIFKVARNVAPCIVFFDEIDSIGCKRDGHKGTSENEQTINALLQEMDGFTSRDGVFIIAATNRLDKLDSALTRAGRFDRQVMINKPRDWKVRKELFKYYLNKFKISDDIDIDNLSKQVSGFTGADIAAVCNEASLVAVMNHKTCVDNACMEEAIDKKVFKGNRVKEEHFKEDKKIVAYHESGHAVMTWLCGEPISRASIIGTTSGVGGAVFGADTDSCFMTAEELIKRIKVCYAGRASEEIKFKSVTTGASNDIQQATTIMKGYIEDYGFDSDFGLVNMGILRESAMIEDTEIVARISKMSKDLYSKTFEELNKNYDKVELLAQKLLELETMSGDEIESLLKGD